MKIKYNASQIDNIDYCEHVLFTYLVKLGFKVNNLGTKYLVKMILFAVSNHLYTNIEDISIDFVCTKFLKQNPQINISQRGFKGRLEYAVSNVDSTKLKKNFSSIFDLEYDYSLVTLKNIAMLLLYLFDVDDIG